MEPKLLDHLGAIGISRESGEYLYHLASDVHLPFSLQIMHIEGALPKIKVNDLQKYCREPTGPVPLWQDSSEAPPDLYVKAELFDGSRRLATPTLSSFASAEPLSYLLPKIESLSDTVFLDPSLSLYRWQWHERLVLPIKICYLPLSTTLDITAYRVSEDGQTPLASCTIPLFSSGTLRLKSGKYYFDMSGKTEEAAPPQDISVRSKDLSRSYAKDSAISKHVFKMLKSYESSQVEMKSWMDEASFMAIKLQRLQHLLEVVGFSVSLDLPVFDHPVHFLEKAALRSPPQYSAKMDMLLASFDPELRYLDVNPIDQKVRTLTRSTRYGPLDEELKPTAKTRDDLKRICAYPFSKILTAEEKDLLWRYRYYLAREKKSLTKLLRSVVWEDANESQHISDMIRSWPSIQIEEVLELLSESFQGNSIVRDFAVQQLHAADDGLIKMYLLQLIQALRFDFISGGSHESTRHSSLCSLLIQKSLKSVELCVLFYWYLKVEDGLVFQSALASLMASLEGNPTRDILVRQTQLITSLAHISREISNMKVSRAKKQERLLVLLSESHHSSFPPLLLPLDPSVSVQGLLISDSTTFKSNLSPLKLPFIVKNTTDSASCCYTLLFKMGDDLRQDVLALQMISLMDELLKHDNLDLKLKPYKVLATGPSQGKSRSLAASTTKHATACAHMLGMIQYIKSDTLASILSENGNSILNYLRKIHPDNTNLETFGIRADIMDSYVRSCAGYCVITYLLGVGDRHLDNLLLTPNGNLFHIDFGFILGRDPKPFPPPMKLCKEMVEAMGGAGSAQYAKFKSLCYLAFGSLRKSANLILNLFALMKWSSLPDIRLEPDRVLGKIQEKFRLDLSEDEANLFFQSLINESVNALFPQVIETIHKWSQYWRK